ncbi:MAG: hypothetical protein ACK4ZJ_18620, partial [Allorhizobium sp.]
HATTSFRLSKLPNANDALSSSATVCALTTYSVTPQNTHRGSLPSQFNDGTSHGSAPLHELTATTTHSRQAKQRGIHSQCLCQLAAPCVTVANAALAQAASRQGKRAEHTCAPFQPLPPRTTAALTANGWQ